MNIFRWKIYEEKYFLSLHALQSEKMKGGNEPIDPGETYPGFVQNAANLRVEQHKKPPACHRLKTTDYQNFILYYKLNSEFYSDIYVITKI